MKLIITGANGFVGQHFLKLSQLNSGIEILGTFYSHTPQPHPIAQFQQIDIRDYDAVVELLKQFRPTHILHLAAQSSVAKSWGMPLPTIMDNVNMVMNIVEAVRVLELSTKIVIVGSAEVYAPSTIPISEMHAVQSHNPYALSKLTQERICQLYANSYGIDIVCTRSFNQIGPYQNLNFAIPSFAQQIISQINNDSITLDVGNIDAIRDFSDVRDMVHAYWQLLANPHEQFIYNICSGEGHSLKSLISMMGEIVNKPIKTTINPEKIRPIDIPVMVGNAKLFKDEFKYQPQYNIMATLRDILTH
jgi:GDP-4-dehydro-6-deoxy-D-mannose reductase